MNVEENPVNLPGKLGMVYVIATLGATRDAYALHTD
jgi:hypothetical protein